MSSFKPQNRSCLPFFSVKDFVFATRYIGSVVGTLNKQHFKVHANGFSCACTFRGVTRGSLFAPV
jgi:hypothetical protein